MDSSTILAISRDALFLALTLSAPAVIAATLVGLIIGIFLAATQIQEQSLATVIKIAVVYVVLAVLGSWMLATLASFSAQLLARIEDVRM